MSEQKAKPQKRRTVVFWRKKKGDQIESNEDHFDEFEKDAIFQGTFYDCFSGFVNYLYCRFVRDLTHDHAYKLFLENLAEDLKNQPPKKDGADDE